MVAVGRLMLKFIILLYICMRKYLTFRMFWQNDPKCLLHIWHFSKEIPYPFSFFCMQRKYFYFQKRRFFYWVTHSFVRRHHIIIQTIFKSNRRYKERKKQEINSIAGSVNWWCWNVTKILKEVAMNSAIWKTRQNRKLFKHILEFIKKH